ncbi:3910_t:CDS:2, partial [Racocetra fulgida]
LCEFSGLMRELQDAYKILEVTEYKSLCNALELELQEARLIQAGPSKIPSKINASDLKNVHKELKEKPKNTAIELNG